MRGARIRTDRSFVSDAMTFHRNRGLLTAIGLTASLWAAMPARAHDSWFAPLPGNNRWLALGTGSHFPVHEVAIDPRYLSRSGCGGSAGESLMLKPLTLTKHALLLQAAPGATTCWAQLPAFDIELAPEIVDIYLAEAQPGIAVRDRWAELQRRGKPWIERYTKHARVVLDAGAIETPGSETRADAAAAGPALDLRLETRDPVDGGMPRAGAALVFRLLDQGRALAGQELELRSAAGSGGLWARTDDEGRVRVVVPTEGRWMLRGIELKPAADRQDAWSSRFVTLVFSVRAAPAETVRTASP